MLDWITAESLEKAGAIIVALAALYLCLNIFRGYHKIMTNHLHDSHNDSVKLTEALTKLTDKIDKL